MRFFLILLAMFVISCEQEVKMDIETGVSKPVLNCLLIADSVIKASLSWSSDINDTGDFREIRNATVLIYENGKYADTLTYAEKDVYTSKIKAQAGQHYRIRAIIPENIEITAEDSIPSFTVIDSLIRTNSQKGVHTMVLYFRHEPEKENFYKLEVFEVRKDMKEKRRPAKLGENLRYFGSVDSSYLYRDIEFTTEPHSLSIVCDAPEAESIHIKLSQLSKSYFVFTIFTLQNYLANLGSEYSRVPNYSNVSNKIGIVGACTVTDLYLTVPSN